MSAATGYRVAAEAHVWTIPISPGRMAYLQLPSRLVTPDEWEQLTRVLDLFAPALLTDDSPQESSPKSAAPGAPLSAQTEGARAGESEPGGSA